MRFAHSRLVAYDVILDAVVKGDAIVRDLPRGYSKLGDQTRRALLGAFLRLVEGAARDGDDRRSRLRTARAEASEAAGALQLIAALRVVRGRDIAGVIQQLERFCSMVTGLGKFSEPQPSSPLPQPSSLQPSRPHPAPDPDPDPGLAPDPLDDETGEVHDATAEAEHREAITEDTERGSSS